jgi:hypothetical protein
MVTLKSNQMKQNKTNNMKKKDKIIILKAKVIELKEQLKKAERTCAKQDNEIDMLKETIRCHVENNQIVAQVLMDKNKAERESTPIESTQELFEGKGYVYYLDNDVKKYSTGKSKSRVYWSKSIEEAKVYKSIDEFKDEYKFCKLDVRFEPIGTVKAQAHY